VDETLHQLSAALTDTIDNLVLFEEMDSTHALAVRLIEQMDDEGLALAPTLIIALRQSSGQGRGQRSWASPSGGLYLSWIASHLDDSTVNRLPIAAAAAACSAVIELGLEAVRIKWPNDLVVGSGKLGGLLVHARRGEQGMATVGLGVNLTAAPALDGTAPRPATALADHLPAGPAATWMSAVAAHFVTGLADALDNPAPALRIWRERLIHSPGDAMEIRLGNGSGVSGVFAGVTDEGFLRLQCSDGERVISSGDVIE
jgi:BirA family biotin operon repressor/biotin-[acetyl-CoA-carboxylase] ligase